MSKKAGPNPAPSTMKIKQIKPDKKLRIDRKAKVIIFIIALILIIALANKGLQEVNVWFATHYLQFNKVVNIELKKPIEIRERKVETQEIVRIIETIPNPEDLETDIEHYVYEVFGIENYRLALAIFSAESGLKEDAWHINTNASIDYGIAQINSVNWKVEGCSLKEIVDAKKNIDCAYVLWDRADGEVGNGRGKFTPWSAFKNGAFINKLE